MTVPQSTDPLSACTQDKDTAAAIGSKSYNALMERMVGLTGRPSLTPAPSQEAQATAGSLETGVTSAAKQKASADDTEDVPAHEGLSEQELQIVSAPPESSDMGMAYAQSSAATGGSKPISSTHMAAQHWDQVAAASKSAAAEKPELISKPVASSRTAEVASHTGHISARPASPPEELCEADELQLALKLSLNNTEDSAAALSHPTAMDGAPDCSMHSPAGAIKVPKSVQPSAVNEAVAMQSAGVHGPTLGHTLALSSVQPAEESAAVEAPMATCTLPPAPEQSNHAEMLDHDYVMIAPEEAPADKAGTNCMKSSPGQTPAFDAKALAAPGEGFEQLSMPKMSSDSPVGSQELEPHAAYPSEAAKRALEPLSGDAEASADELSTEKNRNCVSKPLCSLTDAAVVRDNLSSTAAAASEAPPDRAANEGTKTSHQPAPGLDERAMALLAALPKPVPGVGSTRHSDNFGESSTTAQSKGVDASQQHVASTCAGSPATCTQHTVLGDATEEKPCLLHSPAVQPDQAGRMGSSKEAYLIQSFLDNASSQLTEHGLVSLHQVCSLRLCYLFIA